MRCNPQRSLAVAGCCCQMLVTIGVPLFQFFLVFGASKAHMYIVIVTGVSGLLAGFLGIGSALSRGAMWPALHVVVSVTLAALMGGFNTQTYLDLVRRCDLSQAAAAGCSACACAAANSCTTQHLAVAAGCQGCRALGTDLCSRSSRQELLLPYTGLIESVLLALPAVLSLLQLVTPFRPALPLDCEAGSRRPIYKDGRLFAAVAAWAHERPSVQEDWPMTTATPVVSGETGCKPGR